VIKQEEPYEGRLSQLVPIFSSGYGSPEKKNGKGSENVRVKFQRATR